MPVEKQERTATENIPGLRNTPAAQFVEFLASLSQETHRIPDPYSYSVTVKGELFSPIGECLVKDTIDDKTSPLGQLEYRAVLVTEQWAASNDEGVSVWISPPCSGVYDKAAFVVSEIEYQNGSKIVFNRKIVLDDFSEADCMKFAWNLTSYSRNKPIFRNPDEIRAVPLILDTQKRPWIDILEKLIDAPKIWTMIRNGEDKLYKKEALRQAAMVQKQHFADPSLSYSNEAKLAVMQMLGTKGGSCPPRSSGGRTAFQTVAGSAVTMNSRGFVESDSKGERTFPCPACGYINERPYEGYVESCQNANCPDPKAVRC